MKDRFEATQCSLDRKCPAVTVIFCAQINDAPGHCNPRPMKNRFPRSKVFFAQNSVDTHLEWAYLLKVVSIAVSRSVTFLFVAVILRVSWEFSPEADRRVTQVRSSEHNKIQHTQATGANSHLHNPVYTSIT